MHGTTHKRQDVPLLTTRHQLPEGGTANGRDFVPSRKHSQEHFLADSTARKRNAQRYRFQKLHSPFRCCVAVTVAGLCPPDYDLRGGPSGTTEVFKEEMRREVRNAHVVCACERKLGSGTGQGVGSGC